MQLGWNILFKIILIEGDIEKNDSFKSNINMTLTLYLDLSLRL